MLHIVDLSPSFSISFSILHMHMYMCVYVCVCTYPIDMSCAITKRDINQQKESYSKHKRFQGTVIKTET